MPHPEHAVEALTGPSLDGLGFFTSALRYLAGSAAGGQLTGGAQR
jgi:phosphoribosylformylglycinamidine synthase